MNPIEILGRLRARLEQLDPDSALWVGEDGGISLDELARVQDALAALGAQWLTLRTHGSRTTVGTVASVADLIDEALIQMGPAPGRPSPLAALLRIFWIS